ncbi:hypothetical protein [uncultured Rikenella sp.]|uniref:SDH family Clp fold serine proteinase n=1 Tax=uncultured Rikenella sp. TaxID=368003 RepID=UPI00261E9260|nr:hypothetical protein [uncultured Rikenella sp.]
MQSSCTNPQQQLDYLNGLKASYLNNLYNHTGRNVITYYSSWLTKPTYPDVVINEKDKNAFMCAVHKLDKTKGLDLILHTPGGDLAATESIVDYIHSIFDGNIRAIIPQISMSAGSMMALSCKEIIMGKQSCLGPIDPQFNGVACQAIIDEFEMAKNEVKLNPQALGLWQTIIAKYHPTFIVTCINAISWSKELAKKWLQKSQPQVDFKQFLDKFLNHTSSKSHSRHISGTECKTINLNIVDMEDDQIFQDLILSLHHCYMIIFEKSLATKIVENHLSGSYIQLHQPQQQSFMIQGPRS